MAANRREVGEMASRLGVTHSGMDLGARPALRVLRSASWRGRQTPPQERESALSLYLPATGDAIVELAAWNTEYGEGDGTEVITLKRVPIDRELAESVQIWIFNSIKVLPGDVAVLNDPTEPASRYTVIAGYPDIGAVQASEDDDPVGSKLKRTPIGQIIAALRDLALGKIPRYRAEAQIRRLVGPITWRLPG
jgi:hypothetical protein